MYKLPLNELSFTKIDSNSWFDINISRINNNKIVSNLPIKDTGNKNFIRTKKIKIYFTNKQKNIVNKWFDIYRYMYNQTLYYIKTHREFNYYKLRSIMKNSINNKMKEEIKKSKIPSHTIDYAIKDVVSAFKSNFTKLKNKDITKFRMRYKKCKNPNQKITLEDSCFSMSKLNSNNFFINTLFDGYDELKNTFCPSVLGKYIKSSEPINYIDKTCVLCYNKNKDEFILNVPYDVNKSYKNNEDTRNICSIDPGVRTFLTIYSPNEVVSIGNNCQELISKKLKRIDKLRKKIDIKKNENYDKKDLLKLKKRCSIFYDKLKNQIKDLHYKSISFIKKSYKVVLLGNMSTKSTTSNKKDLPKIVKRQLNMLKHYSFNLLLKYKAEIENIYYKQVDESYTSKTCGNCSNVKKKRNKTKEYNCTKCGIKIDRDINGAFNIFNKHKSIISKYLL